MIYDRTYVDIIKAKSIFANKVRKFLTLTEEEQSIMNKAYFNLKTINRIVNKINDIWFYLEADGETKVTNEDIREWTEQEIFKIDNFANIRTSIGNILSVLESLEYDEISDFKNTYNTLNDSYIYTNLNKMEKLLYDIGVVVENSFKYCYVSLGDSIAAGHSISENWENDYGVKSQYGENGNAYTQIVPNSYTDLIASDVITKYGDRATISSYAHSGDTVSDLISKLRANNYDNPVSNAIKTADLVTVCIGANDVLVPAMESFDDYVINGQQILDTLGTNLDANWSAFESSYAILLAELNNLNPKAKYAFTTIYNPYKYLWLEESTRQNDYKDGFFGPLMWAIPDAVGDDIANSVRSAFLNTNAVKTLYNRVNTIPAWVEKYVTKLNNTIKNKITALNKSNFIVADTKKVFESFPDRQISATKHYNDLVNVEFTRGFVVEDMDWGQFWDNIDWGSILTNIENVASNIVNNIVNNVIIPDIDPHPETYGQYVLKCAFDDALDIQKLNHYTITFASNGGSGTMDVQEVIGLDENIFVVLNENTFSAPSYASNFVSWSADGENYAQTLANAPYIYTHINKDTTLNAIWGHEITYRKTLDSAWEGVTHFEDTDSGPMEMYAMRIAKSEAEYNNGNYVEIGSDTKSFYGLAIPSEPYYFSDPSRTVALPHGIYLWVNVQSKYDKAYSYVSTSWDSSQKDKKGTNVSYGCIIDAKLDIEFEWVVRGIEGLFNQESYWNCYIT